MKKIGVLSYPAHANKDLNPYNHILSSALEDLDVNMIEFDFTTSYLSKIFFNHLKFNIFHLHWPTNILTSKSWIKAYRNLIMFQTIVWLFKLRKKKIVWTVHNLNDHEKTYPDLQEKMYKVLYNKVDGFISLNETGIQDIAKKISGKNQKIVFTPHPYYKNYYDNNISQTEARERFNIPNDAIVFLFLGQIRKYKNVTGLIKAFEKLNLDNSRLILAGKVHPEIKKEIEYLTKNVNNVILHSYFIKDNDLQYFLNASDIVVTPYNKIFNSGSIFLNLSFAKPTLAPAISAIPEIEAMVGKQWIITYTGEISSDKLAEAIAIAKDNTVNAKPDLSFYEPKSVAENTIEFYKSLILQ